MELYSKSLQLFVGFSVVLPQIICPNPFSRWGFVTSTLSHRPSTGNHLQLYLPVVVFGWTLGSCCRNFHFSQGLWHGARGWRGWESSRKLMFFFVCNIFSPFFFKVRNFQEKKKLRPVFLKLGAGDILEICQSFQKWCFCFWCFWKNGV